MTNINFNRIMLNLESMIADYRFSKSKEEKDLINLKAEDYLKSVLDGETLEHYIDYYIARTTGQVQAKGLYSSIPKGKKE